MAFASKKESHNWHGRETDHISLVGNAEYEFLGQTKDRKESNPKYTVHQSILTFALSIHTCRRVGLEVAVFVVVFCFLFFVFYEKAVAI